MGRTTSQPDGASKDGDTIDAALAKRPRVLCARCAAPMFWARAAESGKAIPIDYEPEPKGNLVVAAVGADLNRLGTTAYWVGPYSEEEDDGFDIRFVSHFVTCPMADEFRKKGGR
jgi:hypothetical protein